MMTNKYIHIFFAAAFRSSSNTAENSMKRETPQNRTQIKFEENCYASGYAANLHLKRGTPWNR